MIYNIPVVRHHVALSITPVWWMEMSIQVIHKQQNLQYNTSLLTDCIPTSYAFKHIL